MLRVAAAVETTFRNRAGKDSVAEEKGAGGARFSGGSVDGRAAVIIACDGELSPNTNRLFPL